MKSGTSNNGKVRRHNRVFKGRYDSTLTVPPHAEHAESAYLASLLRKPALINQTLVRVDQLYDPRHRVVYAAMLRLWNDDQSVEIGALAELLDQKDQLKEAGGVPYLYEIIEQVGHAEHAEYYARLIIEAWLKRQVQERLIHALDRSTDKSLGVNDLVASLDFSDLEIDVQAG